MRLPNMAELRGSTCVIALGCLLSLALGCDDDKDADKGDEHGDHGDHGAGDAGEEEHEHDPDHPIGPLTGATCPDASTLTYDNFGKKFFADYCVRCHSESVTGAARNMAPADHNFDKLSDIDLLAMHIDQKAGSGPDETNTSMPPSGAKPSLEDRKKLSEWIACGVPE